MCEGGTAELEAKALVWKRNCGTSSRSIFFGGSGTTELPSIIPCAEAEFQTLKVTQYSMCGSGIAKLKVSVYS